jgi:predicted nucleic acid-binding protein
MAAKLNLPRLVAVDTNVALDFAQGVEDVCDAIATIQARIPGVELLLPPTVLGELANAAATSADRGVQLAATKILRQHRALGFRLVSFIPLGFEQVDRIAERLRHQGLLPEAEVHDSAIIVEAAALGCPLLTSSDAELAGVDHERLVLELDRFDLVAPIIATPREIVKKFFR